MPQSKRAAEVVRRLVEVVRIVEHGHRPNAGPNHAELCCGPAEVRPSSSHH